MGIFFSSWILIDSSNPQLRLRRQVSPMLAAEGGSPGTVNQGKRICPDNVSWLQLSRLTFLGAREGEVRLKISRRLGSAMRGTGTPDQGRRTLDQARTTIWTPPRRTSTFGTLRAPQGWSEVVHCSHQFPTWRSSFSIARCHQCGNSHFLFPARLAGAVERPVRVHPRFIPPTLPACMCFRLNIPSHGLFDFLEGV